MKLREQGILSRRVDPLHLGLHRWQVDIDGNVNSWGLLWKLLSGCCVLRVSSKRKQWYHHRLKPWEHFIPISFDLRDLVDQLKWCRENPGVCASIAHSGQILAKKVVRVLEQDQKLAVEAYAKQWL